MKALLDEQAAFFFFAAAYVYNNIHTYIQNHMYFCETVV